MFGEARPYWLHIIGLLLMYLIGSPLKLLMPVPLKIAVDHVIGGKELPAVLDLMLPDALSAGSASLLSLAAIMLIAVTLLVYLNALGSSLLRSYTGERLVLRFRSRLFRHLQTLSLTYHDTRGTTDSTYRIQYDAPAIQWISLEGVIPFISAIVMLLCMICVTIAIDWQLALVAMAVAPVLLILTHFWGRRLRNQWRQTKQYQSSAMSVVQEMLGAVRLVKAFGTEDREHDRFERQASKGMWGEIRVSGSQGTFDLLTGFVVAVGTAAALIIGVRHVQSGTLTLGEFLLVWAYLAQLYGPLQTISKKVTTLQGSFASAERVLELIDQRPEVVEKHHATPVERCEGRIVFDHVSFSYCDDEPVLQDVSFEIEPGMPGGCGGANRSGQVDTSELDYAVL